MKDIKIIQSDGFVEVKFVEGKKHYTLLIKNDDWSFRELITRCVKSVGFDATSGTFPTLERKFKDYEKRKENQEN